MAALKLASIFFYFSFVWGLETILNLIEKTPANKVIAHSAIIYLYVENIRSLLW